MDRQEDNLISNVHLEYGTAMHGITFWWTVNMYAIHSWVSMCNLYQIFLCSSP